MTLTLYTGYSLRVLIYLGLHTTGLASIGQISRAYGISRNHLIKVVHNLARLGLVETTRGRGGGLRLGRDPATIRIGEVVRATEPNFNLADCFGSRREPCPISVECPLKGVFAEARAGFMNVLDGYTLADLLQRPKPLAMLLHIQENGKLACAGRRALN
ncbi:MAG: hypothetical protein AMXMBFR13_27590 [Phycisphaerae bacterium]|jgi:Rrf2 family nitric oxide-sensitive transcriptional repressor